MRHRVPLEPREPPRHLVALRREVEHLMPGAGQLDHRIDVSGDTELDRVAGTLPDNVSVREFYFPAGKFTRNPRAQRDYISTNYTYVARDLLASTPLDGAVVKRARS